VTAALAAPTAAGSTAAGPAAPAPASAARGGAEPPVHRGAEALELLLGDPDDPANPSGFAAATARDEGDDFPEALCARLRETGFHTNYLPAGWGGTFESFDRSLTLVRTAARRDLNVMPGTMFSITAATCVRIAGSAAQQRHVAEILRAGGAVAFALSEADHGSDLLANTARLDRDGAGGYQLTGEKWMVGLARRCDAVYLVARTGARGPGAFTAVLLDRAALPGDRCRIGEPVRTSGMRGIDFADYRFDRCPVPADAVVGGEGRALEAAVRAQQVVRVMSMAGSLACADTALRGTLDFAAGRRVGRAPLVELARPRRDLALASAAVLAADLVALGAARGLHVAPEAFSVWGCAAKHVVAESTEDLIRRCGTVLATRSVLRTGGPAGGIFQKLQRDAAIVRVIDTSTVANLRSFAGQLPVLAAAIAGAPDGSAAPAPAAPVPAAPVPAAAPGAGVGSHDPQDPAVRTVFALDADLPPFDPSRLDLTARRGDPVTAGLGAVAAAVEAALRERGAAPAADLVGALTARLAALPADVTAARAPGGHQGDRTDRVDLVDLAERFAWLHGAACCVHAWWANRHLSLYGTAPGSAGWLAAALAYLLARADGADPGRATAAGHANPSDGARPSDGADSGRVGTAAGAALDAVVGLHTGRRLLSAIPVRLAPPTGAGPAPASTPAPAAAGPAPAGTAPAAPAPAAPDPARAETER
jgi:alkylation response protein AidB-like acyl-CoA dehydrogenase